MTKSSFFALLATDGSNSTLQGHFRSIDPAEANIVLLEGAERILPTFSADLSAKAAAALVHVGVTVRTRTRVTDMRDSTVTIDSGEAIERLQAHTILWTAGVKASVMGKVLAKHTGVTLDRAGRVQVEPDLTIAGHSEIFVIGDLAHCVHQDGKPLPGLAAVAMHQGRYVGGLISQRLQKMAEFVYWGQYLQTL